MQVPALAAVLKGPGHVFELANENFQKLLGDRDVVGLSAIVAIPGLDCTRVQILNDVYQTGRGYRATAEAVTADWRADGQMSERIFDFIYEPILASSGAVEGIWVLAVDVTDKLEMMRQLRISDRLSGIGKLAAGIAHEINNPLAYSVINLELALLSPVIDEQTRKLIDRCLDGLNRAAGIVAGLRLFSKIEDIPLTSIDVQTEIEAAVSIANHEIKKSGAQLSLQVVAGLQAKVQRGSLCQILTNLLVNSAHAIENSEEKQINLSTIVDEINRVLVLRIEDTGCGIEQSRLQKIFQPFETSKTSDKGSGLGLSIVHGLVSAFGGRLSVESSIGVGTAFEITIPLSEVHSKNSSLSGSAEVAPQASSLKKRILIVDDEEQIRLALKVSLQSHDVTCVASISEALAFLGVNGNAVDLI
ncbi:MAG: GHKL domain-containing protein, partial [Proteobacteria bacterium]